MRVTTKKERFSMNVSSEQVRKLLSGSYKFTQLGFSMLLTRLKGMYHKDSSPATVQKCVSEINAFLQKYPEIMASDFAIIAKI
jgi:uncharacterized protein YutD